MANGPGSIASFVFALMLAALPATKTSDTPLVNAAAELVKEAMK